MLAEARNNSLLAYLCGTCAVLMLVVLAASTALRLGHAGCVDTAVSELIMSIARIVHRIAASLVGLLLIGVAFVVLRNRPVSFLRLKLLAGLAMLIVFLATLGRITAGSTQPLVTMGNVIAGIALFALFRCLQLDARQDTSLFHVNRRVIGLTAATRLLAGMQIWLGAWVAGVAAGFGCNAVPEIGNAMHWPAWSALDPTVRSAGVASANTLAWLRIAHEASAAIVLLFAMTLVLRLSRAGGRLKTESGSLCLILAVQAGLGLAMIFVDSARWLGVEHNILAAILLGELARLSLMLRRA